MMETGRGGASALYCKSLALNKLTAQSVEIIVFGDI